MAVCARVATPAGFAKTNPEDQMHDCFNATPKALARNLQKNFEARVRWASGKDSENVSRFYIFKGALVIELNDEMKALEHSEPFVAAIIKGMSEAMLDCYFKAMRIFPRTIKRRLRRNDGTDTSESFLDRAATSQAL